MDPAWLRQIRDHARVARTPLFFKQWGDWGPAGDSPWAGVGTALTTAPSGEQMVRVGKSRAGAELDGVRYRMFPGEAAW